MRRRALRRAGALRPPAPEGGSGPVPEALPVRLASGTRRYGRVLVGGRPRRVMRLTERGLAALDELQAGQPTPAARRLARALLDAGLAHPDGARLPAASSYGATASPYGATAPYGPVPSQAAAPPRGAPPRLPRVAAVVPVRDRPAELARALEALDAAGVAVDPVVVVDDGSAAPDQLATLLADHPTARLVRRPRAGGPAAARNTGFRALRTLGYGGADEQALDFVVLVDSDVEALTPGWVARLLPHFVDPTLAAVAPRVVARPACAQPPQRAALTRAACLASFARWHSPLDLGEQPAQVTPTGGVAYVPTAALVVRAGALGLDRATTRPVLDDTTRPILDEQLRYGEDVDLVWRWYDAGWRVRYEPSVLVGHRDPDRWAGWLVRRYRYGTSAGPLARRHPGRVAPLVLTPVGMLTLGALATGHYRWAARLAALGAAQAVRAWTRAGVPAGPAVRLAMEGLAEMGLGAGRALSQLALPLAALAAARSRRARLGLVGLVVAPIATDWVRLKAAHAHEARLPARGARLPVPGLWCWLVASLADDLAYGAGVWWGALSARTTGPLRPRWVRMGRARRTRATGSAQKTTTPRRFTPSRMSW